MVSSAWSCLGQGEQAPVLGKWVRGCREVRGSSRGAEMLRLGLSPSPIFSMGNILHPAYKVFEEMPERKIFSNFANLFGGLQSYIKRSRMVLVWVNLELVCKISKWHTILVLFQCLHLACF